MTAFSYEYRCFDRIGNFGNTFYNLADHLSPPDGIGACILLKHVCFVQDKILTVLCDVVFKSAGTNEADVGIRVKTIVEKHHFYIQPFFQDHIQSSERSLYARRVAIIKNSYVFGKAPDEPDLFYRQ